MGYKEQYEFWLNDPYFDEATKQELLAIKDNEKEIEERFYKELEFGTGGLRGIIGAGTDRMNMYTVRKATQGLANYIIKQGGQKKGVAPNLQTRLHAAWQQTASKPMSLNPCAPHRSFPLHSAHWAAFPVLSSPQATIPLSITDTRLTGRMAHR